MPNLPANPPRLDRPRFSTKPSWRLPFAAAIVFASLILGGRVSAQAETNLPAKSNEASQVSVGIDGHYRVGRWVGIRTAVEMGVNAIETRDGDGVQVRYQRSDSSAGQVSDQAVDQSNTFDWTYVIPGSEAAPLVLHGESSESSGRPLATSRLPTVGVPSRGPAMIPLAMPWVLVIGDPLGIDQIGVNRLLDRDASIAVTRPESADVMPNSMLGFDGIDMIVMGASGTDLLGRLKPAQTQAIVDWIAAGGKLFLTLGAQTKNLLAAAPWIRELLPVDSFATTTIDPAGIETYTSSQSPLQPFDGVRLPKDRGDILVMGRTSRRISTPIAVSYTIGFGSAVVVAADLEASQFVKWPERLDLVSRLTGSTIRLDERNKERAKLPTAYNDLAGQTRSVLDRFSIQRRFSFSVLALALMALIAVIGPLDYLLVNRVLGKPLLGWLTFPITVIGLSWVLVSQSTTASQTLSAPPAESTGEDRNIHCNRIEIVDVDTINDVGRSYSVNYVYAHDASRFDVAVDASGEMLAIAPETALSRTAPFGYPGESFGGVQVSVEDSRLPAYDVVFRKQDARISSVIEGLPLAPRSSKGFFGESKFTPKMGAKVELQRRSGSELLQGEFINPLPFDVLDAKLVFRNWAYLLPTRLRAGERIGAVEKLRQKNFRWLLSRQKALESSTETQAWDPTSSNTAVRVAEMLMFHQATGGTQYTNLQNQPLGHLDLSDTLGDDRCILYGRLDNGLTSVSLTDNNATVNIAGDATTFTPVGEELSMIRVIMPVTAKKR
ncbi:MAG: hypothetical protein WBD31_08980 [Rubripirellula sp.]